MAYVSGFFAADGYITVNRRGGQFWCIDIVDKKLLERIKTEIAADHKISIRKRHQDKYTSYRLQIGSIEMCDDLRSLGFNERKTKSLAVPNVPRKHFSDFVRGYFDGDGHVWMGVSNRERKKTHVVIQTVFTSCSKIFLQRLSKKLEFGKMSKGRVSKGAGDYYRLTYSVSDSLKLYDFMYNSRILENKLFLQRKKSVFEKFKSLRL
ncbi:MAG: LAGLIDADG family homing endonuclease [Patescibacteria group bacterium]